MDSQKYQAILKRNVIPSADPKHTLAKEKIIECSGVAIFVIRINPVGNFENKAVAAWNHQTSLILRLLHIRNGQRL